MDTGLRRRDVMVAMLITTFLSASLVQAEAELGPVPTATRANGKELPKADVPFDMQALKSNWRSRIAAIKASGKLPIIDIESNYNPKKLNPKQYAKWMDEYGVALIAFAPSVSKKDYRKKGKVWTNDMRKLIHIDPWRYIPVSTAPADPAWSEKPEEFLSKTFQHVESDGYPLMSEFEFRHYMSGKQYKKGATHRDLDIPIDGESGDKLFAFSEKSGVPFQIHQDIEDKTLAPLEKMLEKYPKAKVIWCHFTQMRYKDRNTIYGPGYIRKLIESYPNLYFDMAFGLADHTYPGSGEYDARIWDQETGKIKPEWQKVIEDYPWRFLAAFDIGGNRIDKLPKKVKKMRRILDALPEKTREIIAYKAAWKLLFNEDVKNH